MAGGAARMAEMRKALDEVPLPFLAAYADRIAARWNEEAKGVLYRGKPHPTFDEYLRDVLGLRPMSHEEYVANGLRMREESAARSKAATGAVCNGKKTLTHRIKRRARR